MTEIRIGFANELFKKTPVIAPDVANKAFNMRSTQQNLNPHDNFKSKSKNHFL